MVNRLHGNVVLCLLLYLRSFRRHLSASVAGADQKGVGWFAKWLLVCVKLVGGDDHSV